VILPYLPGSSETDVRNIRDTPTEDVAHSPGQAAVQQSPTPGPPGENDLFHEQIPDPWRVEIFAVMAAAPQHTFQVLTKRPGPMASLLNRSSFRDAVRDRAMGKVLRDPEWAWRWPLLNVWLGTSVEDQKWADVRIPKLLETPAAVRCVPLLRAAARPGRSDSPPDLERRADRLPPWRREAADGVVYAVCPS
jgi:hypothetical protein